MQASKRSPGAIRTTKDELKEKIGWLKTYRGKTWDGFKDYGKEDGFAFAKSKENDYEKFYYTIHWLKKHDSILYHHDPREDPVLGDYFNNITSAGPLKICEDFPNEFYAAWIRGWQEAVEEFWAINATEIKHKYIAKIK